MAQPIADEEVRELVTLFGLALRPGSRRAEPDAIPSRQPLEVLIATLMSIRDELGLSAIRLGELQQHLHEFSIDLRETWNLMQSIKQAKYCDPDPREHFPVRPHAGAVIVIRLPG